MTAQTHKAVMDWKLTLLSQWVKQTGAVGIIALVFFAVMVQQYRDYKLAAKENSLAMIEVVRQSTIAMTKSAEASKRSEEASNRSIEASERVLRELRSKGQ